MKKQYIKPAQKSFVLLSTPLMLTISGGDPSGDLTGNSNKFRGLGGFPGMTSFGNPFANPFGGFGNPFDSED